MAALAEGHELVAAAVGVQVVIHSCAMVALRIRPRAIALIFGVMFAYDIIGEVVASYFFGGLYPSGITILWGLIAVLGALLILSVRAAAIWFVLFAASVMAVALMDGRVEPRYFGENLVGTAVLNLVSATLLTFLVLAYFVRQRDRFQKRSDDLLHNILPSAIAARLRNDATLIADSIDEVSVLFADVVGFTPLSKGMPAPELIGLLNEVFSTIDGYASELGLEKIKTVGDEYMVASGVPVPDSNHAFNIAKLALRIRDEVHGHKFGGHRLEFRIGISSGPVVAGVIGTSKFAYDLWGETVNTASRMESSGMAGQIQISGSTYAYLKDRFDCRPRDSVDIKGLGVIQTYLLVG